MKKRVKLFTTIASLCLAVALMAFGVYAATTVTVSVTNQVSFTATPNVKAVIWHETAKTNAEYKTGTGFAPLADTTEAAPDVTYVGAKTEENQTIALGDGITLENDLGSAQQMTYSYTIYIKNTAPATDSNPYLKVEITAPEHTYAAADGYGIVNNATDTVLAAGAQASYTVTITIDNAHTVNHIDLGSSVKLTAQATNE